MGVPFEFVLLKEEEEEGQRGRGGGGGGRKDKAGAAAICILSICTRGERDFAEVLHYLSKYGQLYPLNKSTSLFDRLQYNYLKLLYEITCVK